MEGVWEWKDRTPTTWLNKFQDKKSEDSWINDCGAIYKHEPTMRDEYCYEKKGFICRKQLN